MAQFKRRISPELAAALDTLADPAAPPNWWKDVLASKDLLLAVRGGYLNAYANGQSVFKIGNETGTGCDRDGNPLVTIHYKYLLEPSRPAGKEYVRFTGASFEADPRDLVCTAYHPGVTLPRLVAAAKVYAGREKPGVHIIAAANTSVVDLEIAFTETGEGEDDPRALRIDLAALHPDGDTAARLVFYEAKCADDARLRSAKGDAEVVRQMETYDAFLRGRAGDLARAYIDVCRTLVTLRGDRSVRPPAPIVLDVAEGRRTLSVDMVARLLVFGFDRDQKDGEIFVRHMNALQTRLARPLVAKGKPASFDLLKDYVRFPSPVATPGAAE
jgi:hypothetical protein